jgi:ribosome biogenesis protein NSA1
VHSAYPPPSEAGQPQEEKGTVLEKVYMKSIPTCVVWDGVTDEDADKDDDHRMPGENDGSGDSGDDEDVWESMQVAEDSETESKTPAQRRRTESK